MHQMLALPSFLGFLLPLPALRDHAKPAEEDYDSVANDPRWVQRPDLER
jgi:hypothetical protein